MDAGPHRAREPNRARPRGRELGVRVVSALVLAPLAIGAAYVGGRAFLVLCGLAALGVCWEWVTLSAGREAWRLMATGAGALLAAAVFLGVGWLATPVACIIGGAVMVTVLAHSEPASQRQAGQTGAAYRPGWIGLGVAYAGTLLVAPVVLRNEPDEGFTAIMFLFAVVWTTDVVAYFTGQAIGGPKLAPGVSPNKTWSGALGGAAGGVLATMILVRLARLDHAVDLALVGLALSLAAQAGDLFESALKRRYGVKDASALIPGHGGLMDRLDGFIAAALLAAVLGLLRGGPDAAARGLLIW